jgi:uncharacterized protein involved in outer membrane biogenesis
MNKKLLNILKVFVIILLTLGILFLIMIQWKSDAMVRKVVTMMQSQMADSLKYDDISLEWFRHFPSASLQMTGLHIGDGKHPLITGGNVDVVLRLFPLLREQVIINKIHISYSEITITKKKGRWTYDIFKKEPAQDTIQKEDVSRSSGGWQAMVRQIEFDNTLIHYLNP